MTAEIYSLAKALHIMSFVAWMAGVFYLPRLFVYHTRLEPKTDSYKMFCEMERKLLSIIMRPAAISTWVFGLILASDFVARGAMPVWLLVKIACVLGMTLFHASCAQHAQGFERGRAPQTERYYRFFNEVPTVFLVAIVLLAVFKPTFFGW
ncbi:MAG: CopD family protein [Neomegalonema sp.]|nr:CopD family protein [Neomegalonema sp.]